jgi:hypothetical protein
VVAFVFDGEVEVEVVVFAEVEVGEWLSKDGESGRMDWV